MNLAIIHTRHGPHNLYNIKENVPQEDIDFLIKVGNAIERIDDEGKYYTNWIDDDAETIEELALKYENLLTLEEIKRFREKYDPLLEPGTFYGISSIKIYDVNKKIFNNSEKE